ncbi:MAG: BACON domain-containing protein, partial [Bacteroidales bacterium]|nr:BACON domain-containing protein [Candidatus Hennigimonas equi]
MKAKYIIASLVAACALAIGCTKETPTLLDEIQVDSSYVGLTNSEGTNSKTITVTAKDSWSINAIPEWLTINPMSGSAGETKVTFSAQKATATRENTIKISCAGKEQTIIIKQEAEKVEPKTLTVAEAIEICNGLADKEIASGEYRVKGIVCSIVEISVQYGNATFWLSDNGKFESGKTFEVYRALWLNGAAVKAGDSVDVGDEVIIEGKIMKYGTTPETAEKQAYVYQINKSLIKCDSLVYNGVKLEALPIEGGEFQASLVCKGDGVSVTIPDDAKSWLSVTGIQTSGDKATVSFLAAENKGGDRSTDLTFVTTSGGQEYTAAASVAQKGAILEVSIAEFNAAEVGDTQYRVSGMVTNIAKAEYGNIYIRDWSGETYIYGIGAKGDFEKTGIKVGDILTVVGKRGAYGTTIEMLNTVVEKVISVTEVDFPTFLAAEKSKDVWYRLTGTITNIEKADYGNLYIKDEAGNEVYVYGVYPGYGATGDNR